jgi:hypothetical protein
MAATKQSLMQAFTSKMKTPDEVESSDGDPWIRNSDYWVRIQLRIRPLSSVTFRMQKNNFFVIFFSSNLPAGTLSSVLKFLFFCQNFVLKSYFASISSVRTTPLWEGSGSGAGCGSVTLTNGSRPWRPKNMRIRIPNTGRKTFLAQNYLINVYFSVSQLMYCVLWFPGAEKVRGIDETHCGNLRCNNVQVLFWIPLIQSRLGSFIFVHL